MSKNRNLSVKHKLCPSTVVLLSDCQTLLESKWVWNGIKAIILSSHSSAFTVFTGRGQKNHI